MNKNKKICRACLLETGEMRSLFATGTIMGQTTKLVEIMLACADLKIGKDDGLPQQICMRCINQVSRAFSFKLQCEKNQKLLLQNLKNPVRTKLFAKSESEKSQTNEMEEIISDIDQDISLTATNEEAMSSPESNCDDNAEQQSHDTDTEKIEKNNIVIKEESTSHESKPVKRQIRTVHKCKACGGLFNLLSTLKLHYFKEHSKPKYPKCELCGKVCRSDEQMKRHINIHNTGKPFRCEICDKSFCQRAAFVAHTYSHTGERPFLCTVCGKAFKQNSELKIHMRTHLDLRPYSCDVCGKSYRNSSLFSVHKRVHSGERPFACTFCDKRFFSSSCLKNHVMIHTGEKPFTCDYCGRSFNRSNALNIHRKIHTGERPHVCSVCGKGFIQAHCLQSHMNTHKSA